MTIKTATRVGPDPSGWQGNAGLYRLDPPMEIRDWDDKVTGTTEYVVVSAVYAFYREPETYVFAADSTGWIQNWAELRGSYRGGLDHEAALNRAGYDVAPYVPGSGRKPGSPGVPAAPASGETS